MTDHRDNYFHYSNSSKKMIDIAHLLPNYAEAYHNNPKIQEDDVAMLELAQSLSILKQLFIDEIQIESERKRKNNQLQQIILSKNLTINKIASDLEIHPTIIREWLKNPDNIPMRGQYELYPYLNIAPPKESLLACFIGYLQMAIPHAKSEEICNFIDDIMFSFTIEPMKFNFVPDQKSPIDFYPN